METLYHDNALFVDYLSRLDTGKNDLSSEEIEEIALRKLRNNSNKKLLSNVNVDCFCMGYKTCQNTLLGLSYNPEELAEYLLKHAEDAINYVETSIAYAGGMQTEEETNIL